MGDRDPDRAYKTCPRQLARNYPLLDRPRGPPCLGSIPQIREDPLDRGLIDGTAAHGSINPLARCPLRAADGRGA